MSKSRKQSPSSTLKFVGRSLPRPEGVDKVTGRSVYTDDMRLEGCLYGKTIRSRIARGRIKEIRFGEGVDWDEFVVALPGDIPGRNAVTLIDDRQPLLAGEEIRHQAEPVALIAHRDRYLVEKAAGLVDMEVEELPAIFSIEEARTGDNIQYGEDNLFKSFHIQDGDPDAAFQQCSLVLEETYRTGAQEQLYIEPNAMIARARPGREVTIWGSLQCPFYVQTALAPVFDLPEEKIRVVQMETGGAFGGKEEYPNMIAGHAALLSWKAGGQPVRLVYDRREDLWATTKRHPSLTRIKAGFSSEGILQALDIEFDLDGGAYPTLTPVVLSRGVLHSWGPYRCPNVRIVGRAWMTNSVPYGAFRGFGAPQSVFAIELHMSRAARALGIDAAEIRRRNLYRQGDRMPTGQVISEPIDLTRLLDRALEESDYPARHSKFERETTGNGKRKGIGLSVFYHGAGFTGSGEVRLASKLVLELAGPEQVEILASNVEYGQGTNTTFTQIAAETCRIPAHWIRVRRPDTGEVPNSGPTVASRTTMVVGRLVERACRKLLEELGLREGHSEEDFRKAARLRLDREGRPLQIQVQYEAPEGVRWNEEAYRGDAYAAYSWSCDVAEVEVDPVDYSARVTDFVSVVECGRVINPVLAAGQVEGGVAQAIGFALYEDCVLERGAMVNCQHTNYIIPTSADTPPIRVYFESFPYHNPGAYGAKGIGELPMNGPAPAIAAAVAQALGGLFINQLPLLPERIMAALAAREGKR